MRKESVEVETVDDVVGIGVGLAVATMNWFFPGRGGDGGDG